MKQYLQHTRVLLTCLGLFLGLMLTFAFAPGLLGEVTKAEGETPVLQTTEGTRRVSDNSNLEIRHTDYEYSLVSVLYQGEALTEGRDFHFNSSTQVGFESCYLASLGLGERVFTFHFEIPDTEQKYDAQFTLTQTAGDIAEVRFRQNYRSNSSSIDKQTYTGNPITFNPLLYVGNWTNDNRLGMLKEGVDYKVSYENNVNISTAENKAKIILTGIGKYAGSVRTEEFTIQPQNIVLNGACFLEVTPNFDWPLVYNGKEQDLLNVTVKANGKLLTKGEDYTVSYDRDKWSDAAKAAVGTNENPVGSADETLDYYIQVTGIGNYTGTWSSRSAGYDTEVQYRIMPRLTEAVVGTYEGWSWTLDTEGLITFAGEGEMPSGMRTVNNDTWGYNYKQYVKRAVFHGNITKIAENALWDCFNLTDVTLPETVETLGPSAFYSCRCLKSVHAPDKNRLPEALKTVLNGAFGGNTYNLKVYLPDNVTTVEVQNLSETRRIYCRPGTVTEQTLKATGGVFLVEGYEDFYVEGRDNYSLGGTYTVYRYTGPGGDMVLPNFLDSITHYDIFSTAASRVTKLTIPGNIKVLHGDAFRSLSNCAEVVIEPGEMTSLIGGLLNGHGDTVLTIPDTVTEMPENDFAYFYDSLTLVVGENSAAHQWAVAHGYQPDDGTGIGRLYRFRGVAQPYITPSVVSLRNDTLDDLSIGKNDGDFTFDSLKNGEETLVPEEDYTISGKTLTIKKEYLEKFEPGKHVLTFHYTGTAGDEGDVLPEDPALEITYSLRATPALTVTGYEDEDITANCTVVWKEGSTTLEEPISVLPGTELTYTVTPGDALKIEDVQYYTPFTGKVTLNSLKQAVPVTLGRKGSAKVTPELNGEALSGEVYTITWFDENGNSIGTGKLSPLKDEGTKLFYSVTMAEAYAEDYQPVEKKEVIIGFGNQEISQKITLYEKSSAVLTVKGKNGVNITDQCTVEWIKNGKAVSQPFQVIKGTKVSYTVTPKETLKIDGVQYYKPVSGEVTLNELDQAVEVTLPRQGSITVSVTTGGAPLPVSVSAGYTITWYDESGSRIGSGALSPMKDEGTKLSYAVSMTGTYADDYPNVESTEVTVGFGNREEEAAVLPKNNLILKVTGTKLNGEEIKPEDYSVFWYTKEEDGSWKRFSPNSRTLENGVKLIDLAALSGTDLYYEIAPRDRAGVLNWIQFKGIPLSDETKLTVTNAPQTSAVNLEAVSQKILNGKVTNADAVGRENISFAFSQTPWSSYTSVGGGYYSYSEVWKAMTEAAVLGNDSSFSVTAYDFPLSVTATDKTGNYKTIYKTVAVKDSDKPLALTFEPESLPNVLFMNITRQYPSTNNAGYSTMRLNYSGNEGEFGNMEFTLYNKTKDKVIDPALYTITPTQILFNDISRMTGVVDTYDELTLSAVLLNDAQAVLTKAEDTVQVTHNYNGYSEEGSLDLSYSEFGRAYFTTETTALRASEGYAVYDTAGNLAASGSGYLKGGVLSVMLKEGRYKVVVWRSTNWISPAETLSEMLAYFTGEYEGLYVSKDFEVAPGLLTRVPLGATTEIKPRPLFAEGSQLTDEEVNCTAEEWVLLKVHYQVDPQLVNSYPGSRYEITVRTGYGYDPNVVPRYEESHTYGTKAKDKYISLYVNGKRKDSEVQINWQDAAHLGSAYGFTLYTDEPEGDVYFYAKTWKAGAFSIEASGTLLNDQYKDAKRSASLGTTVLRAEAQNALLCFASDCLRTEKNGNGTNGVWVYTKPNAKVTLYMDDVAIEETSSNGVGVASFSFKMSESGVGTASRSAFTASCPAWRAAGPHTLYAVTDGGIQSAATEMECVTEAAFDPAVLTRLTATSYTDDETDPFNGRTQELYRFNSWRSDPVLTDYYFSVGDKGTVFSYKFTATLENADAASFLYLVAANQNGQEYMVRLEREEGSNTFSGMIADERLLFTNWSIVIRSKRSVEPKKEEAGPDDLIFDPVAEEAVTVSELENRIAAAFGEMTEEEKIDLAKSEFDIYKNLLREITDLYYENADDFDWDSLDGSEESMENLRAFFGYTTGTAADVDYESWGEDCIKVTTEDGRTLLYREEFTVENNENYFNSWAVILPTDEDPEGWSETHRVDLGQAQTARLTASRTAAGLRLLKDGDDQPQAKPKNYSAGINISGAAKMISRVYQKQTGQGQKLNYTNISLLTNLTKNQAGTSMSQMQANSHLEMMDGLDNLTDVDFTKGDPEAAGKFTSAYDELSDLMDKGGYKSLESCINGILNNLENSLNNSINDPDFVSYAVQRFSDFQNGDSDEMSLQMLEDIISDSKGGDDALRLLNALGDLQEGIRKSGYNFDIFNAKKMAQSTSSGGGSGNARATHDPQGIVYETDLSHPVEGAIATLYERAADGTEKVWNAEDYGQVNPQVTGSDGQYQWFVPEGEWQVRITAPEGSGLLDNTSENHPAANLDDGSTKGWLPVMPVQMGIDIALATTEERAAAEAVGKQISALPEKAGTSDKEAVQAARKAYDALTDAQKAFVTEAVLQKLEAAEASIEAAEDKAEADKVIKLLKEINSTTTQARAKEMVAAYNALTKDQQALVLADKTAKANLEIAMKKAAEISIAKASVKLKTTSAVYNGKAQKPAVLKVKLGSETLTAGKDYKVTYENNVNAGTAKVIVTGKGNYTGKVQAAFKITKAENKITKVTSTKTVKAASLQKKARKFQIAVAVKGKAAKTFKLVSVPKSARKYIQVSKTGNITLKKGLRKGMYKIKVKIIAQATNNYRSASITKTIKIVVR